MVLVARILFNTLGLLLISKFLSGITLAGFYPALITALSLGFLNIFIRPLLLVLAFPITIVTLGLFSFVINALLFWFASSFIKGFEVASFGYAFIGSLFMGIVNTIGSWWLK